MSKSNAMVETKNENKLPKMWWVTRFDDKGQVVILGIGIGETREEVKANFIADLETHQNYNPKDIDWDNEFLDIKWCGPNDKIAYFN